MGNQPQSIEKLSRLIWHLARDHTWGGRVMFENALRQSFSDSERGEARRELQPLIKSHGVYFLHWSESDREVIQMRGDRRVALAYWLKQQGYEEYRIEATVSRFKNTDGGFDGTERPDVTFVEPP